MNIWTYVITVNGGTAPNCDLPATTLAICKPRIREHAKEGEIVLAFNGTRLNAREPHSVCWAGIIAQILPFAEYWNDLRFQRKKPDHTDRPDNIYQPTRGRTLEQVENDIHNSKDSRRDTGGKNVLVFGKFWHFGAYGPTLPTEFGLRMKGNQRRGHHKKQMNPDDWKVLRRWLNSQKTNPTPNESDNCAPCARKQSPCMRGVTLGCSCR